jgi:hypothetical protein
VSDIDKRIVEAAKASMKMLRRERDNARKQRIDAEHERDCYKADYHSALDASRAANWTCPECLDEASCAGDCRECFIDDRKSIKRVPGAEIRAKKLAEALRVAIDLINSDFVQGAFTMATVHGYAASHENVAKVEAAWKIINDAIGAK